MFEKKSIPKLSRAQISERNIELRETTTPRTGWLREISREIGPKKCFQKRSPSRQTRMSRETPPSASRGRTTTCTARAAKPTTHVYICCQFSSIRCSGFASGLSNDFSPSAQTLLANAPSLVPFQVPPWSNGRQRFPRYFNTSNPRFKLGRLRYPASHTLHGWRHFRPTMFHSIGLPAAYLHQRITLYQGLTKGSYSAAGLSPAVTRLSYPKTSPFPVSASQSRFPLVTLRHF